MIKRVGELTGTKEVALDISNRIAEGFQAIPVAPPLNTLYLIWREPYMSIGGDTFIHHILERIGLKNVCADFDRYPELKESDITSLAPDLILLSSEPYPFTDKHIGELQVIVPQSRILLV